MTAGLVLGLATSAGAQVVELKTADTVETTGERLPAPAEITALQQPGGGIQVTWSPVDDAAGYRLTRSIPPAGPLPLAMTDARDTLYVDSDVRPGNTYYYAVAAVNQAGVAGPPAAAAPLNAVAPSSIRPPDPPGDVRAVLNQNSVTITWSSSRPDVDFRLERGQLTSNGPSVWLTLARSQGCCLANDRLESSDTGIRVVYRVTAVDSLGTTSLPALSNEIRLGGASTIDTVGNQRPSVDSVAEARTVVRAAVIAPAVTVKVGASLKLGDSPSFLRLRLDQARWLSLDESKATVDARGQLQGRSPGSTHVVAIGKSADGSIASLVQPVEVTKP
jgi:hypothetical protein